jgi:diguanylate cyclase (GGDEF)-like protein
MPLPISLAALEEVIRSGNSSLPAALDKAFEDDRKNFLAKVASAIVLRSIISYNIFLLLDWLLLPKTLLISAFLHLCVVTPYMIIVSQVIRTRPQRWVSDSLSALFPVLMVVQIMTIYRLNCFAPGTAQAAGEYQYLALLAMVFTNTNQLLDMRFALAASAATAAIYLAALMHSPAPEAVKITGAAIMLACAYISLEAKHRLERGHKYNFLRRLRERMHRDEAENEASRDALTGLSNRRHFDDRATALAAAAEPSPITLVMIDIDHFKLFNDRYGHQAGDHCLKRVAGVLSAALRGQDDLAIRFGGEEFLLLLPQTPLETGLQIAERVRRAIETMAIPHEASPTSPVVTASLGIAAGPTTTPIEPLLAQADTALYQAKNAGRNQAQPPFITLEPGSAGARRSGS